jgi:hypothetical protein
MKKTLVTLLVLTVAALGFACGGESPNANANKNANTNTVKMGTPTPAATVAPNTNGNGAKPADANGNKMAAVPQGKTVDEKTKEKADALKTAPAAPAPATPKKP